MPSPFTVLFPVGSPSIGCVPVTIVDDSLLEGNHDFNVFIADPGEFAMTGAPTSTVFIIEDDESKLSYLSSPTSHVI